MTRTEFYQKACLAYACNSKTVRDNQTAEQHVSNISHLAMVLTDKVAENSNFDLEFELPTP